MNKTKMKITMKIIKKKKKILCSEAVLSLVTLDVPSYKEKYYGHGE